MLEGDLVVESNADVGGRDTVLEEGDGEAPKEAITGVGGHLEVVREVVSEGMAILGV